MNGGNKRELRELVMWLWQSCKRRVMWMMLRGLVFVVKGITYCPPRTHLINERINRGLSKSDQ